MSRKNTYTNSNNTTQDNSVNLADATLNEAAAGALIADEVGSYTKDSGNNSGNTSTETNSAFNITGEGNVFTQFGTEAASVVKKAISAVQDITTKNLQLNTDKDLVAMESGASTSSNPLSDRRVQLAAGSGIALLIYLASKRKK